MVKTDNKWDWEIKAESYYWDFNLRALLSYRHLLVSLVRRDFLLNFQQTVLGPAWLLVQPILTLVIYTFVFGKVIGIANSIKMPPVLFYFSGIILWNFFNESFGGTSRTFRDNIHIFSKVYFPRIIMPVATITTHLLRFCIQLSVLLILITYYDLTGKFDFHFSWATLVFPLAILSVALLSLSLGLIVSVVTAKYRDIANLVEVCIRLLFFITPVLYPLSFVRKDLQWIVSLNPLTPLFELAREGLYGQGSVTTTQLAYTFSFIFVTFLVSLLIFNKRANKLIDVV